MSLNSRCVSDRLLNHSWLSITLKNPALLPSVCPVYTMVSWCWCDQTTHLGWAWTTLWCVQISLLCPYPVASVTVLTAKKSRSTCMQVSSVKSPFTFSFVLFTFLRGGSFWELVKKYQTKGNRNWSGCVCHIDASWAPCSTMELKATLAAEGDFLSTTAQVDKNNKHLPSFFVSPKTPHMVKPTGGLPDALMPLLSPWSHRAPKSDH